MRLSEALFQADALRPNVISPEIKIRWLWRLEAEIAEHMEVDLPELTPEDDPVLLMPDPYSNIYPLYLCPSIDWAQEEMSLYQVDTIESNAALEDALSWWTRNHESGTKHIITGVFY